MLAALMAHGPLEAAILINEVLADPAADANVDGTLHVTQDEFIELVNTAPDPRSLAGWSVSDLVQVRHVFGGDAMVPGYGFFLVFGGGVPQGFDQAAVASSGSLGLNNAGDTISLWDAGSQLVDVASYGGEGGQDASLTRFPDAAGPFALHTDVSGAAFSPGRTVDGFSQLPHAEPPPDDPPQPGPAPIVPEPASSLLMAFGLTGLSLRRRRV
jgi:hypothetical protein